MAHRQPVAGKPDVHNVLEEIDVGILIGNHNEGVEREPAQSESSDARYHHFHHL